MDIQKIIACNTFRKRDKVTSKHHEGNGQVDKQRQVTSQYIGGKRDKIY